MKKETPDGLSRRSFLQGASILGSGALLLGSGRRSYGFDDAELHPPLPRRVLGKTKQQVTALALGTWPCGRSEDVDTAGVSAIVNEAIDLGINFIDTARNYGKAEEGIGKALGKRRDQVFLTTKVWADDAEEARRSLEESLRACRRTTWTWCTCTVSAIVTRSRPWPTTER